MKARKPKATKVPGRMREVLATNVKYLMARRFPEHGDKISQLARKARVARSSVQRIVTASHGASIDTIESVAGALKVSVPELLR